MRAKIAVVLFVAAVGWPASSVVGEEKSKLPWEIRLEVPKEIDVEIPLEDGRPARPKTDQGRYVYKPVAVLPVTIVFKNIGDRPIKFGSSSFDIELLDPQGKKLFNESDYQILSSPDGGRETQEVKPGDIARLTVKIHFISHTPLDGQSYRVQVDPPRAEGTFIGRVKKHKWEGSFATYRDSVLEVRSGDSRASGTIFKYDREKKLAYAFTIGKVMKDSKRIEVVQHWRKGSKVESPKPLAAEAVVNYRDDFGVLRFPLDSEPMIFPIARPGYDYGQLADLIACRWSKEDGVTARLVAYYAPATGGISVIHSQPWEGIGGAALFDRYGYLVGIGVQGGGAHRAALGVFADEQRIRQICSEQEFTLPEVGYLGAAFVDTTNKDKGIRVERVLERGVSDLRAGDVVMTWNGREVEGVGELLRLIGLAEPGSKARLGVIRDGKQSDIVATIVAPPARASRNKN